MTEILFIPSQSALQVKSRFLAIMSHEIRTPLTGTIGALELLSETPLTTDQRDLVQTASLCGEQLQVVINDILDHSRLEENKLALETRSFSLHDAIEVRIHNSVVVVCLFIC